MNKEFDVHYGEEEFRIVDAGIEAIEAIKNGEGWRIEYMQLKEKLDMNYDAGLEEGEKKGIEKTALVMLQKGKLSNQDIAEYTGLTISDVEKLAKNLKQ